MVRKSSLTAAKEAAEKVEELKNSAGAERLTNIAEKLSLSKKADHALELKDVTNKSFLEKTNLAGEITDKSKDKKSLLKRGVTGGFAGVLGLVAGKNKESDEIIATTTDAAGEVVEIATDEKKLKETNDTFQTAIEAERKIKEVNKKVDEKWGFEKEKSDKDWFKELEKKETKYKKYGTMDALKEAWQKTEFEVDSKTGEKKKRNFFFRLFAFFPALTKTWTSWKSFEKLKESGAIEKVKAGKKYKEDAEAQVDEAEAKMNKGLEAKKEAFSSVFEENPGALLVSKNYFKKLANLTKNADKYTSAERANLIRKYAQEAATKGTKQFGPEFAKMKGFQKNLPGISIKQRGGFMLVEIVGKSLGAALREGSEEGGWARALDTFKEEIADSDNWKDACPIWGTIRSGQRLSHDDGAPQWSKWLDFGLSAGMDIASGIAIVGSLGLATPGILAARTAAGAAAKGGVRKLAMKQMLKQSAKSAEKVAAKNFGKQSRKQFGKQAVRTAGGKWAMRLNLMMTTVGEFFGEDIDESVSEAKLQARDALMTEEQKRFVALTKAAKTGGELPPSDVSDEQEDENKKQNAGVFSSPKKEKSPEEGKAKMKVVHKKKPAPKGVKDKAKGKVIELLTKGSKKDAA